MPLDMLRYYIKETLDGLAYLHSNAVVHEDLRVNILSLFLLFCIDFYVIQIKSDQLVDC